ncbi:MAG TPA: cytochrome c oxidase subunit II [Streptosporangiaceae bacterium]|nr:cytochrome c oxidase subunit II [Streptosporangiaceae bacterium]
MSPNNRAEGPRAARPYAVRQRAGWRGAEEGGADHGRDPGRGPLARRIRRWLPRAAALFALAAVTTGCDGTLGLRAPLTTQAQLVVSLWRGSWIAAFGVGAVVWGGILWAVIFFRKRGDRLPQQVRYNLPIEILYTVVPFIMVGVLFYFTARDENRIDDLSATCTAPHCTVVDVTGFQWSWEFQYPQYAVKNSADGVTEVGYMWNGVLGAGSNENELPLLEIPDHETVRFNLTSNDVIHSFWVLPFDFKRDVLPGHPNHFQVYPTATLYSGPDTIGRCSELCGLYHSRMLFRIKIVTPAQFKAWVTAQQKLQNASGGAQ